MNEEFDKYVRNLLQDAEEEVSPRVWEGVAAGLNRKARVVPVWRWAAVSVAAAAAVVAAFVVFHSNPSISYQETPSATAMAEPAAPAVAEEPASVTEEEPVSVPTKAVAVKRSQPRQEVVAPVSALPADEIQPVAVQPQQPVRLVQKNAVPVTERTALLDDHSLLNQLAYTERQKPSDKGFSLIASGQIQGNQRGEVPSMAYSKPYSAPPFGAGEGIYNETPETNFRLPFSIGLAVRYNFTNRWAVGTGVRYTNLGRTFIADFVSGEGITIPQTDIDNEQHWLGVPLNVYYDIVNRGRWRVHAFVGGAAEFLLDNDFLVHYSPKDIHYHQNAKATQWSVAGGLGVEFRITPHVGIYLDPNFRYYFNTENQPRSLRTIQPLRFEMEAGVRFSFGQK
jgi:hypothetical protein